MFTGSSVAGTGVCVIVALAVAVAATVQGTAVAAERTPVVVGCIPRRSTPRGYWICVEGSNGQCLTWKTCIRGQGGDCRMWVYMTTGGGLWRTGPNWWQKVDCRVVTQRLAAEPSPCLQETD